MAISESQLEIWAKQGSITQSAATYKTIKGVLENSRAPYAGRSITSFLQGSYCNDTNVYAESDVDIVIRTSSLFFHDLDNLSESDKADFQKFYSHATYSYADYKREVTSWLVSNYGSAAQPGNKAIFVEANNGRRNADVVVAAEFRRYQKFKGSDNQSYVEGICFLTPDNIRIENFPKQHSENCTIKHQATKKYFKPLVRILKNMRNRMVGDKLIKEGLAPSYFIEGMLYNVPNDSFGTSYEDSFVNAVNWILNADRSKFVCANEQYYLLREGSPVTWRDANCTAFLDALCEFWRNG
jgi:hypothetical protein